MIRRRQRRWVSSFLVSGTGIVLPGGYPSRAQSAGQINDNLFIRGLSGLDKAHIRGTPTMGSIEFELVLAS